MISSGDIVLCRQTGTQLWVIVAPAPGGRWHLRGKRVERGRGSYAARIAGAGDLVMIREPKVYEVGAEVVRNGTKLTVVEDRGDRVVFTVPATSRPLRGGGALHIAAGNQTEVGKADLTSELF
jgi:hypothetical protein